MTDYQEFIHSKTQLGGSHGFKPLWMPDFLFDFQKFLVTWSLEKGRCAKLADCGLGKTLMQLVWSQNVIQKTNKPVLILTPLAVNAQTIREGEKFGIKCRRSLDSKAFSKVINVTNYERLEKFNPNDFGGMVCDESSILKNFDGRTKTIVTEFMRKLPYRLLCTATAAPNDYIELGTSSEALGEMGYMDMLGRFFKNDQNSNHPNRQWSDGKWRFRGHAERDFWRWVCSWARAVRKPRDLGFDDGEFVLPELKTSQYVVEAKTKPDGFLFDVPAHTLDEQRKERRRTIIERCEMAAKLCGKTKSSIAWCSLNDEADTLAEMIPGAKQIEGHSMSDEKKEEVIEAFISGEVRVLVAKPSMLGLGMNFQHCAHQTFFPSHSFEQYYQGVRRSWRFGQKQDVSIDVITSEGEARVLANLQRKAGHAEEMFSKLVELMNNELHIEKQNKFTKNQTLPSWLS